MYEGRSHDLKIRTYKRVLVGCSQFSLLTHIWHDLVLCAIFPKFGGIFLFQRPVQPVAFKCIILMCHLRIQELYSYSSLYRVLNEASTRLAREAPEKGVEISNKQNV